MKDANTMSKKPMKKITREEAKARTQVTMIGPPTMDATLAEAVKELGERERLRVLAHVSKREAVILAIGIAWIDYLNDSSSDPSKSYTEYYFENLSLFSAARSGIRAKQLTEIARAHAGGGEDKKEGKFARFMKAVGMRGD